MLFAEEEAPLLKAWIVKRIENTSDADSDVLAEYVIALLKHDGDQTAVRTLCEQEIPDFLSEDPKTFLDDVFRAIQLRSYVPGEAQTQTPSAGYDGEPAQARPAAHAGSRKRALGDGADAADDARPDQSYGNYRSFKQPRRGGRRGSDDARGGRMGGFGSMDLPPLPPGMPHLDVNNTMEAMLQMQAMGIPFPGLQGYPQLNFGGSGRSQRQQKRKGRCRDFDTKGFCSRGSTCVYDHGNESIFVLPSMSNGEEYDPNEAVMHMSRASNQAVTFPYIPDGPRGRGDRRHRGNSHRGGRRGGARAPFSTDSPVQDRSKSTIVIENIPEGSFSEDHVRSFFSQFGNIVQVSMQPYKHLAIVKYDTWDAANDAYNSPKVIFENRFVKIYWCKGEAEILVRGGAGKSQPREHAGPVVGDPGPDVDMEEFTRKQEEAQRKYQERQTKREELERKRQQLEKQQQDLLAKHQAETEQLRARLTDKNGGNAGSGTSATELLRTQLAALEQEAKILGLDPSAVEDRGVPASRGGFRGKRGYRGRGAPRSRGIHRGQGGRHVTYAQYSIDNRPRKLAVRGVDFTPPERDEALRHFLLVRIPAFHCSLIRAPFGRARRRMLTEPQNLGEFESVENAPSVTHVSFQDRKTAERFFRGLHGKELPGVEGRLDLSWVEAAAAAKRPSGGSTPAPSDDADDADGPAKNGAAAPEPAQRQVDMDYEVSDEAWDESVR